MKQIHTGETITVTYMVNGKYVPSAMKKINWFLRDWRRNEATTMDPRTIDLVWELHADLGSKKPVHIVSGYRSAKTNAFLKRSGRNVAKKSQHIQGKAMDIFFPDVPTIKMRNSALVRKVGGVGYYRSAGGPTGFLHVDSGRVRHWGPGIGSREMAKIFKDYRKTVGARKNKASMIAVAGTDTMKLGKSKASPETTALYDNEDMAELAESAAQSPATPKTKPKLVEPVAETAVETVAVATPVPKPRPKPIEILMAAAMNIKVEPVSAPPEGATSEGSAPVYDNIALSAVAAASADIRFDEPAPATRGTVAAELNTNTSIEYPTVPNVIGEENFAMWPSLSLGTDTELRLNGQPQQFADSATASIMPGSAIAAGLQQLSIAPSQQEAATGKGDMLVVNREGKGNFGAIKKLKVGSLR